MIVVGNLGHTGLEHMLIGSVSETIVRRALDIAADICVFTNRNVTIETLKA